MKKSIKSKLVKTIAKNFVLENLYSPIESLRPKLQQELNEYLNFETKIYNIEKLDNGTFFQIHFLDANSARVIDVTVTEKNVLVS